MAGVMSEAVATANAAEIPDKLFFRIGEVSTMLGVEPVRSSLLGKRNSLP